MPKPATSDGPWGEAISYWLNARRWRQSDLLDAVRQNDGSVSKNTISNAVRGFDTTTRVLRIIAAAFKLPIDAVLVSPERRLKDEDRRRFAIDVVEEALRRFDQPAPTTAQHGGGLRGPVADSAADALEESIAAEEREKARSTHKPMSEIKKPRRKRGGR